jgi:hypothetical protein
LAGERWRRVGHPSQAYGRRQVRPRNGDQFSLPGMFTRIFDNAPGLSQQGMAAALEPCVRFRI